MDFDISVKTARAIYEKMEQKQLPSKAVIKEVLRTLESAVRRCKAVLKSLHADSLTELDAHIINNGLPGLNGLPVLDGIHEKLGLPLIDEKRPLYLTFDDLLDLMIISCSSVNFGLQSGLKCQNELFALEKLLADEFAGTVTQSDNGDFAKYLREFRDACGIPGFHSDQVDKTHIHRLLKR